MLSELWGDPPWSETGESLPWREVIAETPDYLVMLTGFIAYSTGLAFAVDSRVTHKSVMLDVLCFGPDIFRAMRREASGGDPFEHALKIDAGSSATRPGEAPSQSTAAAMTVAFRSGEGDAHSWKEWWWMSPLPTADTLDLALTWRAGELGSVAVRFDAHELRAAAARSRLWGRGTAG
jgi:hypothetical protein